MRTKKFNRTERILKINDFLIDENHAHSWDKLTKILKAIFVLFIIKGFSMGGFGDTQFSRVKIVLAKNSCYTF